MIQFKHPEVLWALVLLVIPIIIHLFYLRRFKKTRFTNVAVLKHIKIATRKSSQLKKWIILLTRLGLITMAVLAFAQPFIPKTNDFNKPVELIIYLDNSFSLQAKGSNGSLLNQAKQELINYLPETDKFTLFTNNSVFKDVTKSGITSDLIELDYASYQLPYNAVYLKAKQLFTSSKETIKQLLIISDFQEKSNYLDVNDNDIKIGIIPLKAQNTNNVSIDSVFIEEGYDSKELKVFLSNFGDTVDNMAISLFQDNTLLTKSSTEILDQASVSFTLNSIDDFRGRLEILDDGLSYDNQLFFTIENAPKINVLSLNGADDSYLKRIYTVDEFNFSSFEENAIDYSKLSEQNLIILNHLKQIPEVLTNNLKKFKDEGGSVLIIPAKEAVIGSYNSLFSRLNQPSISLVISETKKITEIVFDHPLLSGAFYSKVTNFQYPEVSSYFKRSKNLDAILKLEDGSPFFMGKNKTYSFSADLNTDNSNFKNSQLIVPALYDIGRESLKPSQLYYTIANTNTIVVQDNLQDEDIVSIVAKDFSIIPRQRSYGKYTEITTIDEPSKAGHYQLELKVKPLSQLSYNYNRTESRLAYNIPDETDSVNSWSTMSEAMLDIKSITNVTSLWKWFAIFALVLLLLEMLILKYFK